MSGGAISVLEFIVEARSRSTILGYGLEAQQAHVADVVCTSGFLHLGIRDTIFVVSSILVWGSGHFHDHSQLLEVCWPVPLDS